MPNPFEATATSWYTFPDIYATGRRDCVPPWGGGPDHGVIHAYRAQKHFDEPDYTFARIVCDEAYAVKTIAARQHQAVAFMGAPLIWFLVDK
ncbi:hypothetical protein BO71DRAFT_436100 [Aspergillus ellipticus CBS 707.79]|uniref:Uncharacterized protein n=1 Tax=Aspergillus ellipticus CBS 707.79 TaxID=1448320 RepID=A0A319CS46_9EURO|nr:hypothetical protein BO71DRAFT_436100 [Aspergillus ellipticus CBS 707.79]